MSNPTTRRSAARGATASLRERVAALPGVQRCELAGSIRRRKETIGDIDLFEVNEAFAAVTLTYLQEFDLSPDRVNVNGGAIALTHPLGATGARITTHLLHELNRRGGGYGLGSACIGGGQGIAIIVRVEG